MALRPPWILLARDAHCLSCLCDRCSNVQGCLEALSKFVHRSNKFGSPKDKALLTGFELNSSISELLSKVLHPKEDGQQWHRPECYNQTCTSTETSPCGSQKLMLLFQKLIENFGSIEIKLFQHLRVSYVKSDGSKGTKMEQVESHSSIKSIVDLLDA